MGRVWPTLVITSCALLIAACGSEDRAACPATAATSPASPVATGTTTKPPRTTTKPVEVAALAMCSDVKWSGSPLGDGKLPDDCKLTSRDSAGFSFIVRHQSGTVSKAQTTIDVTGADGTVLQTLYTDETEAPSEPYLADLDGDGRDELIVPLVTAIVGNTTYEVFRPKENKPEYARAGQVFGLGVDRSTGGYVAGESKSGPADKYIEFQRFVGSQLVFVAEIIRTFNENGHSTCRADTEKGVPDSGLSDDEVARRFCGEELVAAKPVG